MLFCANFWFLPYVRSTIGRLAGEGVRFSVRTMRAQCVVLTRAYFVIVSDPYMGKRPKFPSMRYIVLLEKPCDLLTIEVRMTDLTVPLQSLLRLCYRVLPRVPLGDRL